MDRIYPVPSLLKYKKIKKNKSNSKGILKVFKFI